MNKITLIGNLTKDPELSQTPNGVYVCKFVLAVNRNYTNADGGRDTDFFNVTAWRTLGENCAKYLSKGSKVAIQGSLHINSYTDKDGIKRSTPVIIASDIEFLTLIAVTKDEPPKSQEKPKQSAKKTLDELRPIENEDLPF